MFFSDYHLHSNAQIRESLFWEYDLKHFDWQKMKILVVQRIIERGRPDDFYGMLNLYGLAEVKEIIKEIPYLNRKDQSFVCSVFGLKKEDLKCCIKIQLQNQHWDS
jgi:uncharacterized protein DUF6922